MDHLMPQGSSHASFERINLEGSNVGAAMVARRGTSSGEANDCCGINIYISNNIQGVNNSILVGSEVNMGDPGVWFTLKDAKLDRGFLRQPNKRRDSSSALGLLALFLLVVVLFYLALFF
ncbi:hypothetical protein RJ639_026148 [Escallonia herrerae]|uniref:Uncharacterized protein n=1 Tax=Escallonia herrerae TaxID=1293975 RepID=A0AA89AC11_9ASTE|nr:hypothetical protein RJ639_026148 [Escallonia herrerae]